MFHTTAHERRHVWSNLLYRTCAEVQNTMVRPRRLRLYLYRRPPRYVHTWGGNRNITHAVCSEMWTVNVHLSVQVVGKQQVMGELQSVRLHGMAWPIVVVADVTCPSQNREEGRVVKESHYGRGLHIWAQIVFIQRLLKLAAKTQRDGSGYSRLQNPFGISLARWNYTRGVLSHIS